MRAQATSKRWKRGDVVSISRDRHVVGYVKRVARDGSWADVFWLQSTDKGDSAWNKRQPDASILKPATRAQRGLLGIFFALQEAVDLGYLERVSA